MHYYSPGDSKFQVHLWDDWYMATMLKLMISGYCSQTSKIFTVSHNERNIFCNSADWDALLQSCLPVYLTTQVVHKFPGEDSIIGRYSEYIKVKFVDYVGLTLIFWAQHARVVEVLKYMERSFRSLPG